MAVMPEHDKTPRLHPKRLLAAAITVSVALLAVVIADIAWPGLNVPHPVIGLVRMVCAVSWVFWFLAWMLNRYLSPETVAYAMGYVHGVARRTPPDDPTDIR